MSIFNKNKLHPIKKPNHLKRNYTILLVDDEEGNLKSLSSLLEDDYTILVAEDGDSALELIKRETKTIHLIISDQRMPKMTGTEFLTKSLPILPNAVRIILTGYTDVLAIIEAINQARIYKFMMKPYDHRDMLITVKRALETYDLLQENSRLLEELKRLDEEKLEFLRFLSSEFHKPHTTQNPKFIDNLDLNPQVKNLLDVSQNRYAYIQKLTSKVLRYFELSDAKIPINTSEIDLHNLIDKTIDRESLKFKSTEKNITIKNNISKGLACVADEIILREVLSYIINNGFSFIEKIGTISVSAKQTEYYTRICISDTGRGIETDRQHDLFQPFSSLPNQRSESGFGLSLPIAALLVKAHGGRIWCDSQGIGKGSDFYIEV